MLSVEKHQSPTSNFPKVFARKLCGRFPVIKDLPFVIKTTHSVFERKGVGPEKKPMQWS
mgnify:FL=1